MGLLRKIITAKPRPPGRSRRKPVTIPVTSIRTLAGTKKDAPARFERKVFRFLFANRKSLGIRTVLRFRNSLIDGALILASGRRVALEIKYRLNWAKACQTGWQFSRFLDTLGVKRHSYRRGLVIFDDFSGDWARKRRGVAVGWDHWYRDHSSLGRRQFTLHLARLARGEIQANPRLDSPGA